MPSGRRSGLVPPLDAVFDLPREFLAGHLAVDADRGVQAGDVPAAVDPVEEGACGVVDALPDALFGRLAGGVRQVDALVDRQVVDDVALLLKGLAEGVRVDAVSALGRGLLSAVAGAAGERESSGDCQQVTPASYVPEWLSPLSNSDCCGCLPVRPPAVWRSIRY